jgi:outer membrane lipoprotein-sorting protein
VRQRNLIWTSDSKVVNATDAKFPPCSATVPSTDLKSRQIPKGSTLLALTDKTISGYAASGYLLTTTVPGATDAASDVTTEFWISKELGIPLELKFAGKSFGEMQMEFTDIRAVEPPAARFQIPDGYILSSDPQAK